MVGFYRIFFFKIWHTIFDVHYSVVWLFLALDKVYPKYLRWCLYQNTKTMRISWLSYLQYCDIMSGFDRTYFLKTCIVHFDVYYSLVWLFLIFGWWLLRKVPYRWFNQNRVIQPLLVTSFFVGLTQLIVETGVTQISSNQILYV